MSAEHEAALGHAVHAEGAALDVDGLAVVAVGMLHRVQIEDAELGVRDLDDLGAHVVGQILVAHAVVHGAVGVLEEDAGGVVHGQHRAPIGALGRLLGAAVEDHQIGLGQAVGHERAHVLEIDLEGGGIHQRDDLRQIPALGLLGGIERLKQPGAVVFDNHALGAILLVQLHELFQILRLVQRLQHGVGAMQELGVVFLLALLAAQQQRALALGEAVVGQHFGDELRLAALQKARDDVYRCVHTFDSLKCRKVPSAHPR